MRYRAKTPPPEIYMCECQLESDYYGKPDYVTCWIPQYAAKLGEAIKIPSQGDRYWIVRKIGIIRTKNELELIEKQKEKKNVRPKI